MVTGRGKPQAVELKTGYGEVKQILLPDSSLVILNANSSIRIQQEWSEAVRHSEHLDFRFLAG